LGGGKFAIFDQTANASRLVIDSSGNVGIGTNAPSCSLDLGSSFVNPTTNTAADVKLAVTSISATEKYGFFVDGSGGLVSLSGSNALGGNFRWVSATTERMRLDTSGNLLVGATSNASSSRLVIAGSSGAVTTPTAIEMDSSYRNGSPAFDKLKFYLAKSGSETYGFGLGTNADITYWAGSSSSGIHAWYTSQTERVRITSGGDLLVGTTSALGVTGEKVTISNNNNTVLSLVATNDTTPSVDFRSNSVDRLSILSSSNYGAYFNVRNNQDMRFGTNNTERMRIDSSGNLLVGTTSAGGRLAVTAGAATQSPIATSGVTGDTIYQSILVTKFDNDSTTSQNFIQFQINNGGANCGKITANGANTAAFGSTSDQRVKENIVNLPSQLASIMALRPVEFDYLESYGGGHQIGFIAQEMQQVYPDVIAEDASEEKILSITGWSKTEARLVKAIQEQQAIIESLKARLDAANL
jgi:hypothetical protein